MSKAVRSTKPERIAPQSNTSRAAPHLPTDLVGRIATMSSSFRELSALSVLSKSWHEGSADVLNEVRTMALDCPSTSTEPFMLGRRCSHFAQDFLQLRLSSKALLPWEISDEVTRLGRSLPRIWKLNGSKPDFNTLANLFFTLQGVDMQTWKLLREFDRSTPQAIDMLIFDPEAKRVFRHEDWAEIRAQAIRFLDAFLDEVGGGALRDFPGAIAEFGKRCHPVFGSPFHRILFGCLLHQPQAFYGLLQLSTKCNAHDFFEFAQRVKLGFANDRNVLACLTRATAKKLANASKDELSAVPLANRMSAFEEVFRQYKSKSPPSTATPEMQAMIKEERRGLLLNIGKNTEAIIQAIPQTDTASRVAILKPLMAFLRSSSASSKKGDDVQALKDRIKAEAREQNWIPGNPDLKF